MAAREGLGPARLVVVRVVSASSPLEPHVVSVYVDLAELSSREPDVAPGT